ncbi:MAG: carbohydrate-binding protein [Elusimicrobia bacterium]|nr:carbohydrate-binding protein [Elusimicrobiota bacterium]
MGKIIRWCMMLVAIMFVSCMVTKSWADFYPGTADNIYKDFTRVAAGWYFGFAVCGNPYTAEALNADGTPSGHGFGGCLLEKYGGNPAPYLVVTGIDTAGATKAEIYISQWGGHSGTLDETFSVNRNLNSAAPWVPLPLPVGTSQRGDNYFRCLYNTVATAVPLTGAGSIVAGDNRVYFTAGSQPIGMPFLWIYSTTVRVYYSSSKAHPTGTITSPTPGSALGDSPIFTANVPAYTGGIRQVDFIGWYKDINWEGDGRFQNWHHTYRDGTLLRHIGTGIPNISGQVTVTWDTTWIPDQDQPMKVLARIVGNDGMCYITDTVDGLTLSRTTYNVKLISSYDVPAGFDIATWSPEKTCHYNIDTMDNATAAKLIVHTWNGVGEENDLFTHKILTNNQTTLPASIREFGINGTRLVDAGGQYVGPIGAEMAPAFNTYDIPNVSILTAGVNTFYAKCNTQHHALEINWPGPMILVKYTTGGLPTAHVPVISPTSGETPLAVTITCDAGDTIRYTTDNSPVTSTSDIWSNKTIYGACTLKSRAFATGKNGSPTATATYTGSSVQNGNPRGYLPVTVAAGSYERYDKPVEVSVNFSSYISEVGFSGNFAEGSLRVKETDSSGNLKTGKENIAFQFEKDAGYSASSNASGIITFIMDGLTLANTSRYFKIFFDTDETMSVGNFANQVTVTDGVIDEGHSSYKIMTQNATYYYSKAGCAFSSIVDKDGNDWVGYTTAGTLGNQYRGIPNMIHPEGGFHPNFINGSSSLVSVGPVKTKIFSYVDSGGRWECYWDIYPKYAKMTLTKAGHKYWFLYEGVPGGGAWNTTDACVRSNGTRNLLDCDQATANAWVGDITPEWVYFEDSSITNPRSLFFAHHEDDSLVDSNWRIKYQSDDYCTVFGFGRNGWTGSSDPTSPDNQGYMSVLPAHFTLGLYDSKTYADMTKVVDSAYRDLTVTPGTPGPQAPAEPIKLNPDNHHYFTYKNKPTVLVGSNEHYGAVLNGDFDYITYLNEIQSKGLNYTRIFSGVYIEPNPYMCTPRWWGIWDNTLGPTNSAFLCPWARSTTVKGFAGDTNSYKFDLTKWDDAGTPANSYFPRLKDFVKQADDRGIVVELVFFCPYWCNDAGTLALPNMWDRSPMKASNNVNSVGNTVSWNTTGSNMVWDINNNDGLTVYMSSMVTKIVQELNEYNNVIYQPGIETYKGDGTDAHPGVVMRTTFEQFVNSKIVAAELSLSKKHIISQNGALGIGAVNPGVSFLNWDAHATGSYISNYLSFNIPLGNDEITYAGKADGTYRGWGWEWIMKGGALYNMLDLSFTTPHADGSFSANQTPCGYDDLLGGSPALRTQLGILKKFIHSVNFVKMVPNGSAPSGSIGLLGNNGNKQQVYYFATKPVSFTATNLQAGSYKAEWIDVLNLNTDGTLKVVGTPQTFTATGSQSITVPSYSGTDIALRILDNVGVPVVSISTIGVINGSNPPATLTIKADATSTPSSIGIKQIDFYNSSTLLGTDNSAPYECVWVTPAGSANYSITAKATDNNNATTTSAAWIVSVGGSTPPPSQHAYHPEDLNSTLPWSVSSGTTTIQAENYDTGGENVAYHDRDTTNRGSYRPSEGVDVYGNTSDTGGGYHVGYVQPEEWLEYSINVAQDGDYNVRLRASNAPASAGPIHIEFIKDSSANKITPAITVAADTVWRDIEVSSRIALTAGNQIMKLVMEANAATWCGDLNYIELIKVSGEAPNTVATPTISPAAGPYSGSVTVTLGCATSGAEIRYTTDGTDPTSSSTLYSAPFTLTASATVRTRAFKATMTDSSVNSVAYTVTSVSTQQSYGNTPAGTPWQIVTGTTTIEAENYDWVPSGTSAEKTYHDSDSINRGGAYRASEGVDIESIAIASNGYDVGYCQSGEWLEYSVNVNQGGDYKVIARAGRGISGSAPFHIEFGPHDATNIVTPSVSVPNTGGWQTFTDVTVANSITLTAGDQIMKLVMDSGSTDAGNFDYIKLISLTADTTPPSVSVVTPTSITGSGVVVTWTTNEPANSKIEYGLTTSYGSATTVTDIAGVYTHSVTLSGLTQNTVYHYRIVSVDMNGNITTSGDYSFTTTKNDPTPPIITSVRASVTTNGAIITWTTDENSDTQVGYGTTTALGTTTPLDSTLVRLHSVSIPGLLKNKTYYYKVYSRDSSDNLATSAQYSFKTLNNIKHRIYTYYYDDGTTTTKVGASASASLKFKVQVYNLDENSLATDYTGTVTLTTKNSKSSVLDTTDSTLIEADAGEKEVAIPFRSDINTIELTGDVTAPVVINFSDMYIAKLVGYQGGSIRGSNGLKILIPTGVLSANKYLASIKTSAAPAVRNTMKYVNTVNPICYDFGELSFGTGNAPVLENQVFTRAVNITIPYTKADIGTLNEDGLRIYYWTGTDWELVTGIQTVDKSNNTVTATVKHFSTYRILGSYVSADMSNVKVYPTPYNPNTAVQGKLKIINLPMNCIMKLYSVTGEKVRELKEIDFGNLGWLEWDGKNDDGDKVGRAVYIYQIEDAAGNKKTGKFGLIK